MTNLVKGNPMGNDSILVVGGAGYIGSHTCKALVDAGYNVAIFDNLSTGFSELAQFGELIAGDLLDLPLVKNTIERLAPKCIFHFANNAAIGESVQNPVKYYGDNYIGSFNLLEAIRQINREIKLVFSSSCAVYGIPTGPLTEDHSKLPINPYGRCKLIVEQMLEDYEHAYGIHSAVLRYFNAAGADKGGNIGELHEPETHLIPRILLHVLKGSDYPVSIFGNDYNTPDGTCIRDYIHVSDLAEVHLMAMNALMERKKGIMLNVGTAVGYSNLEIVAAIEKVTNVKLELPIGSRRQGDPDRLVAVTDKLNKEFDWKPKHNLESMIESAWQWTKAKRSS